MKTKILYYRYDDIFIRLKKYFSVFLLIILSSVMDGSICADILDRQISDFLTEGYDPLWRDSVVNAAITDIGLKDAKIGIYIEDIRTGEVLADVNGDLPLMPASVTKSVTTATALSLHNPQERFATEVVLAGHFKGSVFKGDIKIRTVGDPTIESSFFPEYNGFADSIADALQQLGVTAIEGSVTIDDSYLKDEGLPSGWLDRDIIHAYGAGHHSANYADNVVSLRMPSRITVPHTPGLKVIAGGKGGKLRVDRKRDSKEVKVYGRIPKRGAVIEMSNPSPESSMMAAVKNAVSDRGIVFSKAESTKPVMNNADVDEKIIYTHLSPSIIEIARSLMHRSDNMMAEAMLRFIVPDGSRDEALTKEYEFWSARAVDMEGVVIEDGSGLSRTNRMTPYFLADINYQMSQDVLLSPLYVSLFPKAGIEGTMKGMFRDTRLEGRLAMKTGTVNGVRALSGYLLDGDDTPSHVVIVMVNDFNCSRAYLKTWIEGLLLKILP